MAGEADLYETLDELISNELEALPTSGDPDNPSSWPNGEAERRSDLIEDAATLAAHRRPRLGTSGASDRVRCAECGKPRPCPTMAAMRDRYGLSPLEYRGDS